MSTMVQSFLTFFERLPDFEKRELASEIIRRTLKFDLPPLSDDALVLHAEHLFLEFDRRERKNGKSKSRRGVAR